ncbi:nucleoside 2-deoxyribosyltransferase [Bacillus toyonensis]|uniref:nucleoside 2-deoxyribosyltransferase n=1 Tax=Bacillus toyonensis TaxID=155322 RepID=UPI001C02B7D6|nr:nucleoside 2-deoxyribosyltransferase [Bacillus toyonensis]UFH96734.1 nucleoside 2-deoxyribosyltransferase [Bacillus toyonensis]
MGEKCPICSNDIATAPQFVGGARAELYKCGYCGDFALSDLVRMSLSGENRENKSKLSAVLRKRRIRGMGRILILLQRPGQELSDFPFPIYLLDDLLGEYPENISDRLNESLINLGKLTKFPGNKVTIVGKDMPIFFVQSNNLEEMGYIIKQLEQDELIEVQKSTDSPAYITVTVKGWNRIAELEKGREVDTKQAFVAMAFSPEMDGPYKNAITKAIIEAGYQPIRIDEVEHNNDITDEIIVKIRQSKFVIADFTGHRGGVYFEAGYALGLGKTVIWTCRDDEFKNIHFDTRQFSHIKWSTEDELYRKLLNRIKATIN